MRVKAGDPGSEDVLVYLDGEIIGYCHAADSDEGWVQVIDPDKREAFNVQVRKQLRKQLLYPGTKELDVNQYLIKKHGKVEILSRQAHPELVDLP